MLVWQEFARYCVLLDCESLINVDLIPLLFIHVWPPESSEVKYFFIPLKGKCGCHTCITNEGRKYACIGLSKSNSTQ